MTATTTTRQTVSTITGLPLNQLDMRRSAVQARQDLAWELRQQGFQNREIMAMVGFNDTSSVSTAIKRGRERALLNGGRFAARRFGVEIEFTGTTRAKVAAKLMELDPAFPVEVQGYNHRVQSVWKLVNDASVTSSAGDRGCEAVSPILQGEEGYRQLATMLTAIVETGGKVDKSCGLHIHHDANDLTPAQVAKLVGLYVTNQHLMDQLVAPSRRAGQAYYCAPVTEAEHNRVQETLKSGQRVTEGLITRFKTINVMSYPKYGTIEIRQHQGTLNTRKITAWHKVGQAMVHAAINGTEETAPRFDTLPELMAYLKATGGLDAEVASYMLDRAEDLNG
jgi:Putative amidoligase enzyme